MHGPINVKSPNNTRKWQMGFNSAFKGLSNYALRKFYLVCNSWYVIPTTCTSHKVFLFNLIIALHVPGVVNTHPQEHKATSSTASGKHYTVIEGVKF